MLIKLLQVINRNAQSDCSSHIGGSGFELEWQNIECNLFRGHHIDHLTTAKEGR